MTKDIKHKITIYYEGEDEPVILYYTKMSDVIQATSIAEESGASQIIVEEDNN